MKPIEQDKKEVIIIDYKLGNLFSVKHACIKVGLSPVVTSDKALVSKAKAIILPGVGAFADAMENLKKMDLIAPLIDQVANQTPIFGICLGMQLLFNESEEFGISKGTGIIHGSIKKFPSRINEYSIKIPHIGWNKIYHHDEKKWEKSPFSRIEQNEYMYFVHSFFAIPENPDNILSMTNYEGFEFCSAVISNNVFATQFHPEKSAIMGIEIYKMWANINFKKDIT